MPSFHPPDYVHLRGHLPPNESQMQLMADQTPSPSPTPDRSPSFPVRVNGTADADDSLPSVLYKKKNIGFWARRTHLEKLLLALLLLLFIGFVTVLALFAKGEEASDAQRVPNVDDSLIQKASESLETFAFRDPSSELAREQQRRISNVIADLPAKKGSDSPAADDPTSTTRPPPSTTTAPKDEGVCTTKGCVKAAAGILSALDQSVNPCEDFYEYACGQWNRDHPIPDDMFGYGTFAFVREHVRQQMRVLLESNVKSPSRSINMARLSYTGCMNTTELERLKTSALLTALEELGYWPLLHGKKWQQKDFDMTEMLGKTRRLYGNEVFFSLYVYADARNTSKNTLYIDQGMLGLGRGSRDYYLNDTVFAHQLNAYHKYLFDVVRILITDANENRTMTELNADLIEIIEFEKKLAEIIIAEDDRRNHTRMYNMRKISDLSVMLPQIKWLDFLKEVMPVDVQSFATNDTEIIVCEIEYLEKIANLLNSTNERLKANYILWRVTQAWTKILDDRFEDIKQDFLRIMTGQQQKSPRWKECTQGPTAWLPLAAGSLYVREHFDVSDKKEALEMIDNLRVSFSELVHRNDWMDEQTKLIAIEKAGSMINHIGYPDFVKNDTALDEHYSELNILPTDSYFDTVRKIIVWSQEKEFRRLLKPFDKLEFEVSPAIVNAFYSPEKNAITFPAGILQPPFFSGEFPKAINYGAIGAVIGHEITHGFDDQGSQFDKDGNLKNWWNPAALKGFENRKECIIDQYSSYHVPDTDFNVNGKLTQGENIADNGGVKEAYMAYRKYVEKLGHEEPRLPGLTDFTNNQLFFLSYAHFWCGHKKQAAAVQQVLTDEHSPEVFRVIGVLSNLQEFSDAFQCPKKSRLNPEKRCVVW